MIQYYLDLQNQVHALHEKRISGGQIQKIYSTAFYVSLAIRTPGKTWHLYLGRGGGYEGMWLHNSPPPSSLRRKDNFLEYFRRHLSSCAILDVALDPFDRILKIEFQKFGKAQSMLFFWKARKLYFIHHYTDIPDSPYKLLLSWRGKAVTVTKEVNELYSCFDEVGRREDMKQDYVHENAPGMDVLLQEELKASSLQDLTSKPTFLYRKRQNIEDDLRRAKQWERLQTFLDKGESLDGYEIKVGDHKIKFEGELNPYERRNLVFQKIKKLRRGEEILAARLKGVEEQLVGKEVEVKCESTLPIIRPVWGKEEIHTKQAVEKSEDEFKIIKSESFQIGIGLNSQGNDQLRSRWASKDDYWFHLDGHKSAHVIVKVLGKTFDTEMVNAAATILAHFSRFNGDWIPVIFTQVKYLKGVTGAPGMVIYKKEKHLTCPRFDISQLLKD